MKIDDGGLTGEVSLQTLVDSGYDEDEICEGALVVFTEGNVIVHAYIEQIREDEQVDFMVYWPS